jgi:hypothetical protein
LTGYRHHARSGLSPPKARTSAPRLGWEFTTRQGGGACRLSRSW